MPTKRQPEAAIEAEIETEIEAAKCKELMRHAHPGREIAFGAWDD
jgi:hypothetical protein